jgi:hypothetical protein
MLGGCTAKSALYSGELGGMVSRETVYSMAR